MSEVSNKRFVHFNGTKQEFIDGGYPDQYQESIVFINGDGNESNNTIYTHGEYYGQGVIVEGDASNSAVLKNGDNITTSKYSLSLGRYNTSGLTGWYYKSIYKKSDTQLYVYLSTFQKLLPFNDEPLKTTEQPPDTSLPNVYDILGKGAVISLINDTKYDNKFKLVGGSNGYVILDTVEGNIPFTVIKHELLNDPEDYSIYCIEQPDKGMFDMGQGSLSMGYNNKATNGKAISVGYANHSYGKFSFTEGRENKAGYCSHAEGRETIASGEQSHSEGLTTEAYGNCSHAEGHITKTSGIASHAEGHNTKSIGDYSHAEGDTTTATGLCSHSQGYNSQAMGSASHAEGFNCITGGDRTENDLNAGETATPGAYAHAEGNATLATGQASHAENRKTFAQGNYSHAEGLRTISSGKASHAEGAQNTSSGECSHSEGIDNVATGKNSHAEGMNNISSGLASHTEGARNTASGAGSYAGGIDNYATGRGSFVHGNYNKSSKDFSFVIGTYNEVSNNYEFATGKYNKTGDGVLFSVGNGTSTKRQNIFEVNTSKTICNNLKTSEIECSNLNTSEIECYDISCSKLSSYGIIEAYYTNKDDGYISIDKTKNAITFYQSYRIGIGSSSRTEMGSVSIGIDYRGVFFDCYVPGYSNNTMQSFTYVLSSEGLNIATIA